MKALYKTFLLILLFFSLPIFTVHSFSSVDTAIDNGVHYLQTQQKIDGSIDGFAGVSDWAAMAFAAKGMDIGLLATGSGETLEMYFLHNPPTTIASSTDWSRRILTVTATNHNPYDFGGYNYVDEMKKYYHDGQIGNATAINDDVFGLLALLSSGESTTSAIITDTLSTITTHQHADGGFSYSSDMSLGSDIDDTAASIIALVAAKDKGISTLQNTIDAAKTYLLSHQNEDGGFAYDPNPQTSWDTTSNVSSTSWVMMALSALHMGSDTQYQHAQQYVISSQQNDGSFPYQSLYPPGDTFDTSYVIPALLGMYWPIHVYTGVIPSGNTTTPMPSPSPTITPTPTETPVPTNTPTPIPTTTSTPTPIASTIQPQTIVIEKTIVITPIPAPTTEPSVLGQTAQQNNTMQINSQTLVSLTFFCLGILFLGLFLKISRIKRN